jgi:hypothetical protein
MYSLNGFKSLAIGTLSTVFAIALATVPALAQDKKPATPQAEPSGCGCCKKMMSDMPKAMPAGMTHSMPMAK